MSSQTNSGRKRGVPQRGNSPQGAKWELLFSSTAITIGVALFFWIGWIYEVKWYGYYGINVTQLDLPVQNIVAQSIPVILVTLFLFAFILIAIYFLRLLFNLLRFLITKELIDWINLLSLDKAIKQSLPFAFAIYFALILNIFSRLENNSTFLIDNVDMNYLAAITILICAILVYRTLAVGVLSGLQKIIKVTMNMQFLEDQNDFSDQITGFSLVLLLILLTSVFLSGMYGTADALTGNRKHGGGWGVKQVYIVSPSPIVGLEMFFQQQKDTQYIYGPLGYVTENKRYLYLIKWKSEGQEVFHPNPGLYLIDYTNGDPINVIPYNDYSISPQPTISIPTTPIPVKP